jgi:peptidoglycan/LPS O-acetylase OafA/YrhL
MSGHSLNELSTAGSGTRQQGYMRQLDALRGLAIGAVLIQHFVPIDSAWQFLPWGSVGVRLFFVLSGFLITSILLDCRRLAEANPGTGPVVLRNFYIRRFLRIFPVYYLTLFVAAALNVNNVRENFWWHASYLSNWQFVMTGAYPPVFHFWSLAVEEQFYLVWPWLIIFLPRRHLLRALVIAILAAPTVRFVLAYNDAPWVSVSWTTPSCLDSLGMGALLAVLSQYPRKHWDHRRFARACLVVGILPCVLLIPRVLGEVPEPIALVFLDTPMAMVFVWLVDRAAIGFTGPAGMLLEFGPLVYLGRISYGVYVFHNFMPNSLTTACTWLSWPDPEQPLRFFVLVAVTVCLAALSWHFFEKPLNDLKRRFPYVPRVAAKDLDQQYNGKDLASKSSPT